MLFFLFMKIFSSLVTHDLLLGKTVILLQGILVSTQKDM